jgi:hypothetical protein
MDLWLEPWCAFMMAWVQTLMDVCINVSCTNAYTNIYIMWWMVSKTFCWQNQRNFKNQKKFMTWYDKNTIHDSMIRKKNQRKMLYDDMGHIIPHHINLKPHIFVSQSFNLKLSNVTCDYPKWLKNMSLKMTELINFLFLPNCTKLHINQFCSISLKI